ncbi:MAG: dihydroxy-acid dehydratase [Desulfobacterales bacterium]|nr:dihydroxy-acid dehydratase [Desulfobacterales bacterium]
MIRSGGSTDHAFGYTEKKYRNPAAQGVTAIHRARIGHIEMEAYNGGPIGAIRDGDVIEIDIPKTILNVRLSEAEIRNRLKSVKIPERDLTPLLERYREKFKGTNCYGH